MSYVISLTCILIVGITLSEAATVQKDSECGKTVGCFHDCSGVTCSFLLTWIEKGSDIELTLTCARSETDPYCAIGLSDDTEMGDDSVFECLSTSGTSNIYVSYNSDDKNNKRLDQNQYGLSAINTSYSNGQLKCSFLRRKTFNTVTGRKKRDAPSASNFFDMDTDWYLLYASWNKHWRSYRLSHVTTACIHGKSRFSKHSRHQRYRYKTTTC
ncbi:putative ferric-chelate reductase 1 homolog [Ruditapes philippinarum]|uniref:putative ferric-chelate reductase 1 homolog n=1 Tax=Ruditapes philippinarum TaxID=129788 RepID=UPI00295AC1D6|nr:putative ferric-chelate reductase 1 homolog [Ruditapes philippinarum]